MATKPQLQEQINDLQTQIALAEVELKERDKSSQLLRDEITRLAKKYSDVKEENDSLGKTISSARQFSSELLAGLLAYESSLCKEPIPECDLTDEIKSRHPDIDICPVYRYKSTPEALAIVWVLNGIRSLKWNYLAPVDKNAEKNKTAR